ncbi:MAG: chemotaxis protein CheB [Planctomycetota bacterium]
MSVDRNTRILIAEDDHASALLLARTIEKRGWTAAVTHRAAKPSNGWRKEPFDVLATDWMMPDGDGMELIRRVRAEIAAQPVIVVVTSIESKWARMHALDLGADDYVTKPYLPTQLLEQLRIGLARRAQEAATVAPQPPPTAVAAPGRLSFAGVVLGASTGGPEALSQTIRCLRNHARAAFCIVQHGPKWMLEDFAERLRRLAPMPVRLVTERQPLTPGAIYLAPGERHLVIDAASLELHLSDAPPENFVRPAADALFRSAAAAFGRACLGVVMTGLGRDGAAGAMRIAAAGGALLVQSPESCVVASMPKAVIQAGLAPQVVPIERLGDAINTATEAMVALVKPGR